MSVESNKKLLEQGFIAWNGGEATFSEWAMQAAAPTIHVHVPVLTITGVEGYVAYNKAIRDAFPDAQVTIEEMVAEGDTLIVRYTFAGTNTGMLLTRPITTSKHASFTTVDIYHFADGKIVDYWQVYDRLDLLEQLEALDAATHPTVF